MKSRTEFGPAVLHVRFWAVGSDGTIGPLRVSDRTVSWTAFREWELLEKTERAPGERREAQHTCRERKVFAEGDFSAP
ncbi:hypothetical protein AAFF_G00308060 [Aldrovandia affinis]|uniref:Uncharacterized protein n=1 Tax=Aldrovandia affinis TaxID=143900 RepID=A0AAD7R825_9TELE|nr:hypothetical protein AAFF_G00308060 [Aldrovandia affinis]